MKKKILKGQITDSSLQKVTNPRHTKIRKPIMNLKKSLQWIPKTIGKDS